MKRCEWCNKEFEPNPGSFDQRYCSRTHSNKAYEERKRARILGRCPKPHKRLFSTREDAEDFLTMNLLWRQQFSYQCADPTDDHYHLATLRLSGGKKAIYGQSSKRNRKFSSKE